MVCDVCMGINSDRCPVCGKEPAMKTCPDCNGEGWFYYAFNIENGESFLVSREEYENLPDDEERAAAMSLRLCKGEIERCDTCDGEGEVEDDSDDEPDDCFEEDRYMEMLYEKEHC